MSPPLEHLVPWLGAGGLLAALLATPVVPPPSTDERVEIAVAYHKLGDARTEAAYRQALAASPGHYRGQLGYGLWLTDQDRTAEAEAALRRAAALKPEEADPWLSLAVLLQKAERYDEARAVYDKLRAAHPDDARLTFNMAMLAIKRHDDREARDLLTAFLKQPGGGRRLQRTARRALEDIEQRVGKPKAGPAPGREGRP